MKDEEKTKDQLIKELTELRHHSDPSNKFKKSKLQELEKINRVAKPDTKIFVGESITGKHTQRFNKILTGLEDDKFTDQYIKVLEYPHIRY